MERIGILGGTFNPVHNEHVALAISAVKELNLSALFVMPTLISPHKTAVPESATDRLNMLERAFSGKDKIIVSDFEILNSGKSYTYLTVEHFKKETNAELYFIFGADMLIDFKTRRYPERILKACKLAVFGRDECFADYEKEKEYFNKTWGQDFTRLSYVGKNCSSTKVRIYSEFGLSLEGLAPKSVSDYIKENGLYKPDRYVEYVKGVLNEKRLTHTANVVITALSKAKSLGLDANKVKICATLHDVAKYLDYKDYPDFILPDGVPAPVVHAFLGAYVAETALKIKDEEILDAIRFHTSGKAQMSTLAKLIFVADMIEEGRDYQGVDELRKSFLEDDFDECFVKCLKEEFIHLVNKGQYIYEQTLNAFAYYVK